MLPGATVLQLRGHTHKPRGLSIVAINDVLTSAGVILEDMHDYSNRMTTYRFELDRQEVEAMLEGLTAAEIILDDDASMETAAKVEGDSEGFIRATLQVTFPNEDGNRRNPNPDMG